MEKLTIQQAYQAMQRFLEGFYKRTGSDDIAGLLSDMDTNIWIDGCTGDPATWGDWMESVQSVLMPDTSENRERFESLISRPENYLGNDQYGTDWYACLLPDGRQLWATVRNGHFRYGGVREEPKAFDPIHGLSSPDDP